MKRRFSALIAASYKRRNYFNKFMHLLLFLAALVAVVPLFSVFGYVISHGAPSLNWAFFTELPKPVGESGGGMGNSLLGTCILVFLGSLLGIPWGILVGLFLSEFGGRSRLGTVIRFSADMLASVPSIIIGLFVYALVVISMGHFSAIAGGLALGLIMVPSVSRTTEELLRLVPMSIREAGLALGVPRWKVVISLVLGSSIGPITTGVMLSVARAAGETAPLLFTAFNNRYWHQSLNQPISSLPVQIYTYAISPFDEWHEQAWAGAFLLVMSVLVMNILTRLAFRSVKRERL
jgi:phosphate transport system permease protein